MALPERDVLLCRDCCCGTTTKHPDTDHRAQRDAIEDLDDVQNIYANWTASDEVMAQLEEEE